MTLELIFSLIALSVGFIGILCSVLLFFVLKMALSTAINTIESNIKLIENTVKLIKNDGYDECMLTVNKYRAKVIELETIINTVDASAKQFQRKWAGRMNRVDKEEASEVEINPDETLKGKKRQVPQFELPEGFQLPDDAQPPVNGNSGDRVVPMSVFS